MDTHAHEKPMEVARFQYRQLQMVVELQICTHQKMNVDFESVCFGIIMGEFGLTREVVEENKCCDDDDKDNFYLMLWAHSCGINYELELQKWIYAFTDPICDQVEFSQQVMFTLAALGCARLLAFVQHKFICDLQTDNPTSFRSRALVERKLLVENKMFVGGKMRGARIYPTGADTMCVEKIDNIEHHEMGGIQEEEYEEGGGGSKVRLRGDDDDDEDYEVETLPAPAKKSRKKLRILVDGQKRTR